MDIVSVILIIFTNIGMFLWLRTEGNADRREMSNQIRSLAQAIHDEMKDFHGRLCTLEERYLKTMEKK